MIIAYLALIVSAALILYIVAGYPLLLLTGRYAAGPRIVKDPAFETTVSAIVAVHNGEARIRRKLESILALDYPRELLNIIVVSDGSADGTEAIVREFADRGVTLLTAPRGGKAAALNRGLAAASGEIVFFTDVRQLLEPGCLRHLVANFADPTVAGVTGELRLLSGDKGEQADMELYWRYEIRARRRHSEIDSIFGATGCIYAMRRALTGPIPSDTLADDAVLPLRAFFRGYRVIFDPAAVAFDYPAIAGTEFRRRFRTLAGLWQVYMRLPELFTSRNRMRLHFLSHKFARLLLPWLILLFFGAAAAVPASLLRTGLLSAGGLWLLLAFVDAMIPRSFPLRRLTSPARTLLAMNVASLASIAVFFVRPTSLWAPTRVQAADDPVNPSGG